jgi:signal transduction histidine kinase
MKKVALVFVLAVLVPSLVLAWLAVRSLRDQQFLLERQQSLLDQHATDTLAQGISDYLAQRQRDFSAQVESLAAAGDPRSLAARFDDQLRQHWPLAEVGFCVTAAGKILAPLPNARPAAQLFRLDNSSFLGNREPVEVYLAANNANANGYGGNAASSSALNAYANSAPPVPPQQPRSSALAELSDVNHSSTRAQPNVASANPGESAGGGGGGGANNPFALATAASITNASSAVENAAATGSGASNSSRNQANQILFTLNNNRAILAPKTAQPQRPQLKRSAQPDSAYLSSPSQAFAISDGAGGGGGGGGGGRFGAGGIDTLDRNLPTPAGSTTNPVLADSTQPSQQDKPELATAKQSNAAPAAEAAPQLALATDGRAASKDVPAQPPYQNALNYKSAQSRKVSPQSQVFEKGDKSKADGADDEQNNLSKVVPAEAEFRQLIGDQTDGMFARFLQNKLKLMCWHRLSAEPDLIFGAQLNLDRLVDGLRSLMPADRSWGDEICLAVLDDNAKPVVLSREKFQANWKRPFVATEVGDALPHWEVAAYLVNPAQLTQAAQTTRLTLGLLIAVLVTAIGIGSLLIVRGLQAELKLARQKTDFVSNVSHELKTPLTSIRMFSELLAEGRVTDRAKQHSYLQIITAEAGRLTRLINNVLDFSRMERGEKKYNFQPCDLTDLVRATAETFRPHLEAARFQFSCELPPTPIPVRGDADALSQIIVNLLSNAEKYSGQPERPSPARRDSASAENDGPAPATGASPREISLHLAQKPSPLPHAEIQVLDRGPGVPRGSEEKIFEKFYRAHDSLSSGVQGSGLGLTIARQIARAHGGEVVYEPRAGGGSCFILRLPVQSTDRL